MAIASDASEALWVAAGAVLTVLLVVALWLWTAHEARDTGPETPPDQ